MKVSKIPGLGRFGTFVDDVDFDNMTLDQWMEIGRINLNSLVTIVRNVNVTPDDYPAWIKHFGEPRYTVTSYLQKKYNKTVPELITELRNGTDNMSSSDRNTLKFTIGTHEVTKSGYGMSRVQMGFDENGYPLGWFAAGELNWHSNEPGQLTFTPGVALLGHRCMTGSATGFMTTVDCYEEFSESFRSELDEMILTYRVDPDVVFPGLNDPITIDALQTVSVGDYGGEVPLVITSPGGLKGLHYSPGSSYSVKGMSFEESQKLFKHLDQSLFQDKWCYDHWYQQDNDLLLFDNSITLHRRLGNPEGRLAYRIAFDYSNLQSGTWLPYHQSNISRKYISQINEVVKLSGITNFKLPGVMDYLKTFF